MQHVVYNDKGVPVQPLVPGDTWLPPGYFPCHAHLLAPAFAGLAFYHLGRTCTFFKLPLMEKCRKTMRVFFFLRIRRCYQVLLKQYKDRQVIRHSFYFFFYSILFLLWSSLHLTIPPRSSNSFLRTRLILSWRLRYSRNLRNRKGNRNALLPRHGLGDRRSIARYSYRPSNPGIPRSIIGDSKGDRECRFPTLVWKCVGDKQPFVRKHSRVGAIILDHQCQAARHFRSYRFIYRKRRNNYRIPHVSNSSNFHNILLYISRNIILFHEYFPCNTLFPLDIRDTRTRFSNRYGDLIFSH